MRTTYTTHSIDSREVASALSSDVFMECLLLLHSDGGFVELFCVNSPLQTKLRGLSPQVNYTDRATASCRRS
jgi:hypothetical protein